MADIAAGAALAHERGVLHRDLKPANILLCGTQEELRDEKADGVANPGSSGTAHSCELNPRITDFGLARLRDAEGDQTRTGVVLGTPQYMAPEQAVGRPAEVGPPADVFSLGVILFELLTRRRPYPASSAAEALPSLGGAGPPSLRRWRRDAPRDLECICQKSLDLDPARRYPDAAHLAADLRRFLADQPIEARRAPAWQRIRQWLRRRPAVAALILLALVVAASSVAVAALLDSRARQHASSLEASTERERLASAETERQRALVREKAWLAKRGLYGRRILLAQEACDSGDTERARRMLDELRPAPHERDMRGLEWHLLYRQVKGLRRFAAHAHAILLLHFARDGDFYTVGNRWSMKQWDGAGNLLATPGDPLTVAGGLDPIWTVAISPDDRVTAMGARNGTITLRDTKSGKQLGILKAHTKVVTTIAFSPDGRYLASGSDDHTVRLWQLSDQTELAVLRGHSHHVQSVVFSPDGKQLASAAWDMTLRLWDLALRKQCGLLSGCPIPPGSNLAFSPDGRTLASGEGDKMARLWEVATNKVRKLTMAKLGVARSLAFAPDGKLLAIGSREGRVDLWDFDSETWRQSFDPQIGKMILSIGFSRDGRTLGMASESGKVALMTMFTNEDRLARHVGQAWCIAFSPDGPLIASGAEDRLIYLFDAATRQRKLTLGPHPGAVHGVAFSPDGRTLAAGTIGATVDLWDVATGKRRGSLRGHKDRVDSVAYSPDGRTLASASWDKTACLWDGRTGKLLRTLKGHTRDIRCICFSPDGRLFATAGDDSCLKLWNAADGRPLTTITDVDSLRYAAFAPDGKTIAAGNCLGEVKLWQLPMPLLRATFQGSNIRGLAFAPDGLTLVSSGVKNTVRFWDLVGDHEMFDIPSGTNSLSVAFSPDGRKLAAATRDGSVFLWTMAQ